MNHDQQNFDTWNKVAKVYEDKFMKMDLYNESYDFLCQSIAKANATILEIGCGPGNISKYLLGKYASFQITGIDLASNMIDLAKKNNPNAQFLIMDARKIGALTTKFDAIVAGFCIPYFSNIECEQFMIDAEYLLNKGGIIYISFLEGLSSQSELKTNKNGDSVYFNYHELKLLKTTLSNLNFQIIKVFEVEYPISDGKIDIHTILLARKHA